MTRDQLLATTRGGPFFPFEIQTTGGAPDNVSHPEQDRVSPEGETILVSLADTSAFNDADHVADFVRLLPKGAGTSKH